MKRISLVLVVLFGLASAFAQNATLVASDTSLSPTGGNVRLTAVVSYDGMPGAVGWSIVLPADWVLEGISGPNVPAVVPDVGSTGTLEFAYTEVPQSRAEFSVIVRYPAAAKSAQATATVLVRSQGKLITLNPAPVPMRGKDA